MRAGKDKQELRRGVDGPHGQELDPRRKSRRSSFTLKTEVTGKWIKGHRVNDPGMKPLSIFRLEWDSLRKIRSFLFQGRPTQRKPSR